MFAFLDNRLRFPDPRRADAEGLVAVGGDLSVPRLLLAYRSGVFPWTVDPVTWWSPDPRAVIDLESFRPPHSLARLIRKRPFELTINKAFGKVMEGCAAPGRGRGSTWITKEFVEAYTQLHRQSHAHSVECWQAGELVGGIYGVSIGGFFAGESMFHRVSNASKVALYHLVVQLRAHSFSLFDIQMVTPVTQMLGAEEIPREEYLRRLEVALRKVCSFG